MPKSKKAGVSSPAGQQQQQHPKKHRKMASFAKLSTTTTTNPAKPKAAQSAHHQPGSGNAKNSNNDRKMKNSQQQQQQLQKNQRPIVPFGRKDRILLVGEGELGSSFLPILLSCALLPVRSMHALPYTFLILAFVPFFSLVPRLPESKCSWSAGQAHVGLCLHPTCYSSIGEGGTCPREPCHKVVLLDRSPN